MRYKNKKDGKLYSIIKYANRRVVMWITTLHHLHDALKSI